MSSTTTSKKLPLTEPPPPPNFAKNASVPSNLTDNETTMQKTVLEHFTLDGYAIPDVKEGQITENEKFWLSHECMLRYLRASKWKAENAIQRLEATLKWRREYGLYDRITPSLVEPEGVTGKEFVFGYDLHGRPGLYMLPSRQNTQEGQGQIDFVVYYLETCVDLMGPGVETLDILLNYAEKAKNPSFGTAKKVLGILQDHYPERLGLALILNVPFLLNAFFKLITPFIDPLTRQKMKFNPQPIKDGFFTPDNLMREWPAGEVDFTYEHDRYWPKLKEIAQERRKKWIEKWREMGGTVGLKEWDYKEGDVARESEGLGPVAGGEPKGASAPVSEGMPTQVETTKELRETMPDVATAVVPPAPT